MYIDTRAALYNMIILYFEWNHNMYLDLRDILNAAEHFVHFKRTIAV